MTTQHNPKTIPNTRSDQNTPQVPSLATLRRRGTMKWTAYEQDVLPLWVAESDFETCPAVAEAIQAGVDREYFGYPSSDEDLKQALTGFYHRRFGWSFPSDWVRCAPDVVKGVTVAIEELTPAGSAIVIPVPAYNPFFDVPGATHRPAIQVPMTQDSETQDYTFDLAALEETFSRGNAGSLILCNPYNPLGRAFAPKELKAVVELAAKYSVLVVSDEIHAPIVYEGHRHTPTASVSDIAANNTVTVTATSKGWNTAGLRCAQMIFTSARHREIMAGVHKLRIGEPSTLGLLAANAAYRHGEAWLDKQVELLSENLDLLERRLPTVLPGASFQRPEATYLVWLNLNHVPGLSPQHTAEPAALIRERAKVAFNEGTLYGPGGEGHVRINIATSPEILNEALDRIAEVDWEQAHN